MPVRGKFAVIGGGAWGTPFARHLAFNGYEVQIWAREEQTVKDINLGENRVFLPGISIPQSVRASSNITSAVDGCDFIFLAVPTQNIAETLVLIDDKAIKKDTIFVNMAKGIERGTCWLPSQIISARFPQTPVVALSGPSFAMEVAHGKPTVLVSAGEMGIAEEVQNAVTGPSMRVYRSEDILGVELGGALKNVFALAAGMIAGLQLGENTRSAMIVRGLAEVRKLALAMGADNNTIFGISGLGDLVLTCTSEQSRNYRMGKMLAEGGNPAEILHEVKWVAEGLYTASSSALLAKKYKIEMPITFMVDRVISGEISPRKAVTELMNRPLKVEFQ
jgi:glycerol-3-phosphate dehydrogenase (NAD(P)+)